jgi:hypothetical protein
VSGGLAVLKPQLVIDQVLNVVSGSADFAVNVPKILAAVQKIGPIVAGPGDLPGKLTQLRDVFRDLNTLCEPLVRMAAGVDLHMVSQVMGAASVLDTTGVVAVASAVVDLLGNVDVLRIAARVGELQEILWNTAITGDVIGGAVAAFGPMLDFAGVAVDAITGAPKQAAGKRSMSLAQGAGLLSQRSDGLEAVGTLVSDGISAATFLASGAHQSYGDASSDFRIGGQTPVDWLTDWFDKRITGAGV